MPSPLRLQEPLDRLYREFDWAARADQDAIRFPGRYPDPADREVVALLAACMAYGRVDLFGPWVDWALARMGDSPARFVLGFDPAKPAARFDASTASAIASTGRVTSPRSASRPSGS